MVGLLFSLLGAAIGFSIFLPTRSIIQPLGIGIIFWLLLTDMLGMYAGGWVTGYFTNIKTSIEGFIHAMAVCGISTLLVIFIMIGTAGIVLSNSFSVLSGVISASSAIFKEETSVFAKKLIQGTYQLPPELTSKLKENMPNLKDIVQKTIEQANLLISEKQASTNTDPAISTEEAKSELKSLITNFLEGNEGDPREVKDKLINMLSKATGKSTDDIKKIIDDWQSKYIEAKEKSSHAMQEISVKIANIISKFYLISFLILFGGIFSAYLGVMHGTTKRLYQK